MIETEFGTNLANGSIAPDNHDISLLNTRVDDPVPGSGILEHESQEEAIIMIFTCSSPLSCLPFYLFELEPVTRH